MEEGGVLVAHFCHEAGFPIFTHTLGHLEWRENGTFYSFSPNTGQTAKLFLQKRIELAPDSFSAARPWEVRENVKAGS